MVTVYRSQVSSSIMVSTVRTAPGAYETSIVIAGQPAEPRRHGRAACETEHDRACDYARGARDVWSASNRHWSRACAEVSS